MTEEQEQGQEQAQTPTTVADEAGSAGDAASVESADIGNESSLALPDPLAPYGLSMPAGGPVVPAERTLEIYGSGNVVLPVAYINQAEAFYHDLFEMDIVLRAWRRDDAWEPETGEVAWGPAMIYGEYPMLSCLRRDDWSLILEATGRGSVYRAAVAHELTVPVSVTSLRRLRARVLIKGYTVVRDQPGEFVFRDPYRIVWRMSAIEAAE